MINLRTARARTREAAIQERLLVSLERPLARDINKELRRVSAVLSAVMVSSNDPAAAVNQATEQHARNLQLILTTHTERAFTIFGSRVLDSQKAYTGQLELDLNKWISQYVGGRVTEIAGTTRKQATKIIQNITVQALQEGLSISQIARLIQKSMNGVSKERARVIASTETHGAAQSGSLSGARSIDSSMNKVWITAGDGRVRESHQVANDQKVSLDQHFNIGGSPLLFPGDPAGPAREIIQCRCAMVYEEAR